MNIRSYQPDDKEAVIHLWRECGFVAPQNNPAKDIERKLKVNPEWFLVGELADKIIASCMAGYEGHRGWVNYLAVTPEQQGKGYARQMMQALELRLLEAGCPKINLLVRETNIDVLRFYEALGYQADACVSMGKRLIPD